ncbi:hypothetical protein QJS10_CPA03g01019 [Acorus calamus]|uniref:Uncharacterized protein n=1 Tax=Acorus calamus TaxID=4465 RepID=A0AAV9F7W2_ACOCL|nr:hypothetical protein QJS10_CPA03g01019 [Acorus calamus]
MGSTATRNGLVVFNIRADPSQSGIHHHKANIGPDTHNPAQPKAGPKSKFKVNTKKKGRSGAEEASAADASSIDDDDFPDELKPQPFIDDPSLDFGPSGQPLFNPARSISISKGKTPARTSSSSE